MDTEQFRNLQESGTCNRYVSGTKIYIVHMADPPVWDEDGLYWCTVTFGHLDTLAVVAVPAPVSLATLTIWQS